MPPSNLPLTRGGGGGADYSFERRRTGGRGFGKTGGRGFIQAGGFMQSFGGVVCDNVLSVSKVEEK
jgi:hypothetical protein